MGTDCFNYHSPHVLKSPWHWLHPLTRKGFGKQHVAPEHWGPMLPYTNLYSVWTQSSLQHFQIFLTSNICPSAQICVLSTCPLNLKWNHLWAHKSKLETFLLSFTAFEAGIDACIYLCTLAWRAVAVCNYHGCTFGYRSNFVNHSYQIVLVINSNSKSLLAIICFRVSEYCPLHLK